MQIELTGAVDMKKHLVLIGISMITLLLILGGCASLGKNQVVSVTIRATAKTNSDRIIEQSADFEFRKTNGETFTKSQIFVVSFGNDGWNYSTNYAEVGYNLHKGETITVFMYHSLANPAEQTITYTYDQVIMEARNQNPMNEEAETLYVTLTPTF